ncbi:hypothetical protein LEP1GSC036_4250 [Leptospira weilii str. 2006001853]|uniref:Uncharacterized protein n=1 Tax=Leptospira weilii str. 2006001853 TaxID=1001589 RepID=A0A828Z0A5_9LEPT|nr:hypothetical protein LEP1GSC036_4250 [Leptospira weilii str. 2006001853]EMN46221.1 hypothetical protein LEP1GSC086_3257 [Leptospira weilii str. LNT 1234]
MNLFRKLECWDLPLKSRNSRFNLIFENRRTFANWPIIFEYHFYTSK